ncbi:hypothetical protein [Sporosarcina ureilytica]|uniref:Uncharacterized protein n=1 Tax=Sporosarcina ureilytica TaxID=298596 RepID=A0A1D8JGB6_9BACL|nr:hypothetical protein [Sporosarcina ureilytica]AOV07736.1 hypothetical protein BI350_09465 [Sporosarcina ureilytica]
MSNKVSVFIMDVSNSSEINAGGKLSKYLQDVVINLKDWVGKEFQVHVSHRAGDELVVVASGYASTYTLAFYLSRIWKFPEHKPYFGLSFGEIDDDIDSLNIETWIHPLMKQARVANELIKKQQNRVQFRFELHGTPDKSGFEIFNKQFETLLNTSLTLNQEQINEQTDIQSLVCSLYLIVGQQNKVSQYLGRSTSTISSHIKNGKADMILNAFYDIAHVLESLEENDGEGQSNKLQTNIRKNIITRLHDYFPLEGRI